MNQVLELVDAYFSAHADLMHRLMEVFLSGMLEEVIPAYKAEMEIHQIQQGKVNQLTRIFLLN